MNYRHAFHAGNFADVLKHWVLMALLQRLSAKDKPYFVLDSHAGGGFYDLGRGEAARTGEATAGILRLLPVAAEAPGSLQSYLQIVAGLNADEGALRWYPGSPYLVAQQLRRQDRLIACDLHDAEGDVLIDTLKPFRGAKAHMGDGFAAIPSMLPPRERRGLILIDPPFERRDDFDAMGRALTLGLKHFEAGIFALWHPIKDRIPVDAFLQGLPHPKGGVAVIEFALDRPQVEGPLVACGMVIVNPPFGVFDTITDDLPWLVDHLGTGPGAKGSIRWLSRPA
jgi:23S rRNA (adenine2030-N6)-methyltransferase